MADVICLTDRDRPGSAFHLASSYLLAEFDAERLFTAPGQPGETVNVMDVVKRGPRVVVTDVVDGLALSKAAKTIFYACSRDGSPLVGMSTALRRQLQVRPEVDLFCASVYAARQVNARHQARARVQHPCVPARGDSAAEFVVFNVHNDVIAALMAELPSEIFLEYTSPDDFSVAKLYIHIPEADEATHVEIPTAGSWGVPSVSVERGCLPEMVTNGDLLLPPGANIRQWTQAVKVAMRDRDYNAGLAKGGSKKWSNLDALADRVKQQAQRRALQRGLAIPPPEAAADLKARILAERSSQAIQRRANSPVSAAPKPGQVVAVRQPYSPPSVRAVQTPVWFPYDGGDVDVSIIVPMFRSSAEVAEQIASWDVADDGLAKEVIYVSDACPQNSPNAVIAAWKVRAVNHVGQIVQLSHNSGFPTACNAGASFSRGKYVLFLNADTTVTPNWVRPMYDLMEADPSIGIVGNMQLKADGTIDSAGSEWMWDNKTFEHIGRNVYRGQRLSRVISLADAPEDLLVPAERDMVTGCCLMMRRDLFDEVGGFDVAYRVGYWEDSDINMQVKSRGHKVYYQPDSRIYHKIGHSRAGLHPWMMDNARLFYERWVNSRRIDPLVTAKRP